MQMTLLDPHPANLLFSQFSWASFLPGADDLAALVIAFELLTRDPQAIVPSNVDRTYQFDEQTPAGQLGFPSPLEIWMNLWGETQELFPINPPSQSNRRI